MIAFVLGACGGGTPVAPASAGAASAGVGSDAPSGQPLIAFADASADAGAAAHRELDLVHEARDAAGLPALVGKAGPAAFTALDAIEAEFGRTVLESVSASVAAAPRDGHVASHGPVVRLASSGGPPMPTAAAHGAIDISIFADTGFTASAIMTLYTGLVERAADSQSGTLPTNEHFDKTADGLRQQVDLSTTTTVQTGGGRVSADITMSATDRISDATSGSFIALYTSTAHGHFDVSACPDRDGVAAGTYTFETKHELNDVSSATASRAGAGRSVEAPFRLIDGDDAHLVQIEAALDLAADAHGPGTSAGPGPTGPFDWGATQQLQLVMPRNGGTTGSGGGPALTGTGGASASGALFISSAMAQLFLGQVAKEAESFWRSGKCIELKPSDDTRKVKANEQIDLKVEAKHKFDGQPVDAPITASFSGTKSIEPANTPVDPPASFTFTAGANKDDKGTIDLKQTSKRGIGTRQIVFTVDTAPLRVAIESRLVAPFGDTKYTLQVHLKPLDLKPDSDGAYRGTGTATWSTKIEATGCTTTTYTGTFDTEISARVDEADANSVSLRSTVEPGPLGTASITCEGTTIGFPASTFLAGWILTDRIVPIGTPTQVESNVGIGTWKSTITVTRPPP